MHQCALVGSQLSNKRTHKKLYSISFLVQYIVLQLKSCFAREILQLPLQSHLKYRVFHTTGLLHISMENRNPFYIHHTAFPYRASTGPEQGFPCVVFPHREKPVFISQDPCNKKRFFPVRKTTQGKPCFHYRDGFAVYSFGHRILFTNIKRIPCSVQLNLTAVTPLYANLL